MTRAEIERTIGITLSAWELIALSTQRVPALTDLLRRNPILGAAAVGWLAAHLLRVVAQEITDDATGSSRA